MFRALITIASFTLVASLTKPIMADYKDLHMESLAEEGTNSDDFNEIKAWSMFAEGEEEEEDREEEKKETQKEKTEKEEEAQEEEEVEVEVEDKGESTEYDKESKGLALWSQGGSQVKCIQGPYVEGVSQAECQELAAEHHHSFYQYREDKRRCATTATCNATIPSKRWNIFQSAEVGTHSEKLASKEDADRTLGDDDFKAQALWLQDTKKAKCVKGPYVESVSQSECQLLAVEHGHSFYQYREDKRRCATMMICNATIPGKKWNVFKIAEPGSHVDYIKQPLEVDQTEDKEESNTTLSPFDVFDMHNHKRNPGREGDCKYRCNNHDRCARYEWDANGLICKMFGKAPTTPQSSTRAAPIGTASTPKPLGCTSCNSSAAKADGTSDSRANTTPNATSHTSSNTATSAAHTVPVATFHNISNATLRNAPNATFLTSSNTTSKIASNATSHTTSSAALNIVLNATSNTTPNARSSTAPTATVSTISSAASSTAPNATSYTLSRAVPNTVPIATSHARSNGSTTSNASEAAANFTSYTSFNTTSNISFLAMHHTLFNAAPEANLNVNPSELPLSEESYQAVAALKDDEAMLRYVRRELHTLGLRSLSESELRGWVPYFSGTKAARSRTVMLEELRTKAWVDELPLSEHAYQMVAALKDDEAMLRYVRRELDAQGLRSLSESDLQGWVGYFSGTKAAARSRAVMLGELRAKEWVGTLPLSEEIYQKVAALKDDEAMLRYVRRELHTLGLRALSDSELRGWVPYFSGTKATQTRKKMLEELRTKEWVGELPLSEESYQKVAALKDDEAMLRYVRRELDALGRRAESEGALRGWVSYFSGTKATRSRAVMLDELRTSEWVISNAKSGSYAEQRARQITR